MRIHRTRAAIVLAIMLTTCMPGCIGTVANLIHAGWGNLIPPRFDQLAGHRIAVVCMSGSSSFGNSSAAEDIAKSVEQKLLNRVPEIQIVGQREIEDWMDSNDWDEMDYRVLGRGINADYLIAIGLDGLSLHDGQTLYKGRATVDVRVYDIPQDKIAFRADPTEIQYPVNGGQHTADTSEREFRSRYLDVIASRIARQFYSYDVKEDYARDPTFVAQ